MPDEPIVSGETTEGADPQGQSAGSTTEVAQPEQGSSVANPAESAKAQPKYGTFGDDPDKVYEGYKALESKLGAWKETEAAAQAWRDHQAQLAQAPQAQTEPVVEDFPPEWDQMGRTDQLKWLDQRSARIAEDRFESLYKERVAPLAEDVYSRQAADLIGKMEQKYPDFSEHKTAIWEKIQSNPALANRLNESVFEDAYKVVTYEKAMARGEQQAIEKLQKKGQQSAPSTSGHTRTVSEAPKNMREAIAMAREELNS